MKEPKRDAKLDDLEPYVADRVRQVIDAMRARGFDPVVFETRRSLERQRWLYGVGRTHSLRRKPITWTMFSRHLAGKAADIISRSRGWDWPEFYDALAEEAGDAGLHGIPHEGCHIQWG